MRTRLTALLLAVLCIGALPATARAEEPTPEPSPSAAGEPAPATAPADVELGPADDGRSVEVVEGQRVRVRLATDNDGERWRGPQTTGGLYLTGYLEDAASTTATLLAVRTAAEPVFLTASTERACSRDAAPCPFAPRRWQVSVTVVPGSAPGAAPDCAPTASPEAGPGGVFLDRASDGLRFTVEVGTVVAVDLWSCGEDWVPTTAEGPLYRRTASHVAASSAGTTFVAAAPGTARLNSTTDLLCLHVAPSCARPQAGWSATVDVVERGTCRTATPQLAATRTVAGRPVGVRLTGTPGRTVTLYGYSRPSSTYRVLRTGRVGTDGELSYGVAPTGNSRLYAEQSGCAPSASRVLEVATYLTITAARSGPRSYVFSGDSMPARVGGQAVELYRVAPDGRAVLTARTRTDGDTGQWRITRTFSGDGRFGFLVTTPADSQNAAGRSRTRSTLVY